MFDSLKKILPQLERQPGWERYRQYRQLLESWQKTVALPTARHTRPLYIKNNILWVATYSAARAQELSFQRYSLLKTLNSQLPFTLKDIRFSTTQWHKTTKEETNSSPHSPQVFAQPFQSQRNSAISSVPSIPPQDPRAAVRGWLRRVEAQGHNLPLCPQCSVPTPEAELQRWQRCYHCNAKQRFESYRSINSINNNKIKNNSEA